MENFIVSARKYRPADFKSVVGQSHITTTLQNAIKTNQLAQAFLFCGPRGVGKTTCARILAKTINCTNLTPELEACNECESCKSFDANAAFNVVELDAASNNSVDDIRSLVDQVRIPPQGGQYKVYIIDEVHMLSQSAFNAFLKTLEEPPTYAKFILATTEKHKIIPTILSRCQIFDFHRIKNEDISQHLEYIAKKEGVKYDIEALHIIAQKSDGGLRDALSMFDQLVSFTRAELTYSNIIENLNILDYDYYFRFVDVLLKSDIPNTLLLFNEVLNKGFEGSHFINGLSSHLRSLLVSKDPATIQLLEVSQNIKQKYLQQSSNCSVTFLLRSLDFSNTCSIEYKDSSNRRLCVEIALLKMANIMTKLQPPSCSLNNNITETETKEGVKLEIKKEDETPTVEEKATIVEKKEEEKAKAKPMGIVIPMNTAFSINSTPEKTIQINEEKHAALNPVSTPLDWENFLIAWQEVALQYKDSQPNLYFSLTNSEMINNGDNSVTISLLNSIQEAEINQFRYEIVKQIKEKISCHDFQLLPKVIQHEKKALIYMPRDKYEFLVNKSPALIKLRAEFDLDIDF